MFRYEYVKVTAKGVLASKFGQHRETIDEYAKLGYKYVGFIPVDSGYDGAICAMDLVFEKEEE